MRLKHCVQGSARFAVFLLLFGFVMLALISSVRAADLKVEWTGCQPNCSLYVIRPVYQFIKKPVSPYVLKNIQSRCIYLAICGGQPSRCQFIVQQKTKSLEKCSDDEIQKDEEEYPS
jgi:hypothetical protein